MQNLTQDKLEQLHAGLLKQVLDLINKKLGKETSKVASLVCEDIPNLSYSTLSDIISELNTQDNGLRIIKLAQPDKFDDNGILQSQPLNKPKEQWLWIVKIIDFDKYMSFYNKLDVGIQENTENSHSQKQINTTLVHKPDWEVEEGKHMGTLKLPDGALLKFYGSVFGGLNILFTNFPSSVTGKSLREEIKKYNLQDRGRNPLTISNWKYELKRNRPLFFKYYDLISEDDDKYRLIFKSS